MSETLGQRIAWVVISILGDDVSEDRMHEVLGEAIGTVVAADHGDKDAMRRVHHAAAGFAATIKAHRELAERLAGKEKLQ